MLTKTGKDRLDGGAKVGDKQDQIVVIGVYLIPGDWAINRVQPGIDQGGFSGASRSRNEG